jgi:hypothetical protein
MFLPKSKIETKLEEEILSLLSKLSETQKDAEEYSAIVDRLSKLHKLKSEEGLKPISPDTALVVAANLFGIIWLTRYERENVISSKALGFVMKPR